MPSVMEPSRSLVNTESTSSKMTGPPSPGAYTSSLNSFTKRIPNPDSLFRVYFMGYNETNINFRRIMQSTHCSSNYTFAAEITRDNVHELIVWAKQFKFDISNIYE